MQYAASVVLNLERSAQRDPQRCAIQAGDHRVTYGELWRRTQALAGYLCAQGLRPGDRVALLLENSPDYVAALYGTLLSGGIAVTLNAAAKARELGAWLAHSEARWLVTDADRGEASLALSGLPAPPAVIDTGARAAVHTIEPAALLPEIYAAQLPAAGGRATLDGARPACIVYTSGTTGAPKGVVLTHANLASNTASITEYLGLTGEDSVLSILPFYYSYGSSVLHSHLLAGGRVVLEPNFVYPHKVVASLAHERVTGFAGVPSTYALLLGRVDLRQHDLSGLRYVTQAGGAMSPALTRTLQQALPHVRLFVMYGQTEATARLTYLPPAMLERKLGSVGIAIPGVQIQVRREDGTPAAAMEPGEVWAHGPNVMQGYWRDPGMTRQVLQDGWLRTGDLGYQDEDGYLHLSGRRSDMIKTGAHRVHPADIEQVIEEIAGVAEVAVAGIDDEILGQAIAAYIVAAPGAALDAQHIKMHCRNRLASYKIPKSVEFLGALPRTRSGKVRRHELALTSTIRKTS